MRYEKGLFGALLLALLVVIVEGCGGKITDAELATAIAQTSEAASAFKTAVIATYQVQLTLTSYLVPTPTITPSPSPQPTPTVSFHGISLLDYLMVDGLTTFDGHKLVATGNKSGIDNWKTTIGLDAPFGITVNAQGMTSTRTEIVLWGRFNRPSEPWWKGIRMYIQFRANQSPQLDILYGGTNEKKDFFFSLWPLRNGEPFKIEFEDPYGRSFSVKTLEGKTILQVDLRQLEQSLDDETLQLLAPLLTPSPTLRANITLTPTPTLAPNVPPPIEIFPLSEGLFPQRKLWVGWGSPEGVGRLVVRELSIHFYNKEGH